MLTFLHHASWRSLAAAGLLQVLLASLAACGGGAQPAPAGAPVSPGQAAPAGAPGEPALKAA
jgi:hypothetical protein